MASTLTCGFWLLAFFLGAGQVRGFNLDTEKFQRKSGDAGSLFGFSLAMHRQLKPQDKRMLLVGAPRANALSRQRSRKTGGLYTCDMASSSAGCARVIFDNDEDLSKESKENQWMGVRVKSQGPGGKVVTCAHRYQKRSNVNNVREETRDVIGRCYLLGQDLKITSTYDEGGQWRFCEGRNPGHMMFGSCQQGLSATFDKDFHYLIFGAPGAYNWKGIVRLEQKNESLLLEGIFDDGPFEAGDERLKNPHLVPVPDSSYLGFSLDSGMSLTKKTHLTVVAGAPRAYHSGAVVLLKKGEKTSAVLLEEHTMKGPGLASSFGYDLTVLDLNKDGWDDIVVGAPQYYEKDSDIGGAIFIYVNKAGNWDDPQPTKIHGPGDSMFGLSVETLGDVNQDGFEDFAVGAPNSHDGAGRVYIYHGSSVAPEKAAQELSGEPLKVKMFGYSLAGNMDLDGNSYPDVAVGSLSDAVFVFKARPVIDIKKRIRFDPEEIDLTNKNCGKNFCLTVEACFSYTANPKNYSPRLVVAYSIEADAVMREKGFLSRGSFTSSPSGEGYLSKGTVTIDGQGKEKCITSQLTLQDGIRDKLHGLPIDVKVDIMNARKRRDASGLTPVLDATKPPMKRSEVQFRKEGCGPNNICESDLQLKYRLGHKPTDKDPFTPLPLQNGVPVIKLSDQKDLVVEAKVTNLNADDAYEASLLLFLPRYLSYSSYRSPPSEQQVSCTVHDNGYKVDCELGNPFKKDSETTFYVIIGTSGISLNTTELELDLQLETTSKQTVPGPFKAKAKVVIALQLSLTGQVQPSQVYFTKNVKGESAMKSESDIGSLITHQFRVINLVKRLADFGTTTLYIDWPKEIANKKWLLYLTKISHSGVDNIECTPSEEIDSLNKHSIRPRRAAGKNDESTLSRLDAKKSKTLTCTDGANCVTIKCPLRGMDSNAVINLHSRLWDPTLTEHFSKYHYVEVKVRAYLEVDTTMKNMVVKNAETEVRLTLFPERHEAQHGGVPWWIIVLTVLLLLLLLGLLAFLLWKFGSFNRAKHEDEVPSYSAVRIKREERAIQPGNVNWETVDKEPWKRTWHDNERYS